MNITTYGAGGIANSLPTMAAPPKSGAPIRDTVSAIEELVGQAHAGIRSLSERLDPVLRPLPPAAPESNRALREPVSVCSHIEERLRLLASGLRDLNDQMQELHARIDI